MAGRGDVRIHWGDAMRMDLGALAPAPTVLVSNLPYSIATPLVLESLWRLPSVDRWCVMAQREVVDRWLAPPGGAALRGALRAARSSRPRRPSGAPSAARSSRRARGSTRPWSPCAAPAPGRPPAVRALVRAAFSARRKTLVNALAGAGADRPPGGRRPGARSASPPTCVPQVVPPAAYAGARRGAGVDRLTLAAPAKINLRLLVGPRGADGYHPLRTLMVALDGLADRVHVGPRRAARRRLPRHRRPRQPRLARARRPRGARRPPAPAGGRDREGDPLPGRTGGRLERRGRHPRRGRPPPRAGALARRARAGGGAGRLRRALLRARGRAVGPGAGASVWLPPRAPRFAALLSMPPAGLSTAAVYARFDERPPPPEAFDDEPPPGMPQLGAWLRNDLWPAARDLAPSLAAREARAARRRRPRGAALRERRLHGRGVRRPGRRPRRPSACWTRRDSGPWSRPPPPADSRILPNPPIGDFVRAAFVGSAVHRSSLRLTGVFGVERHSSEGLDAARPGPCASGAGARQAARPGGTTMKVRIFAAAATLTALLAALGGTVYGR